MINLGLTDANWIDLHLLLRSHHSITTVVRLLDTSHNYIDDLSSRFIDGTVTIDAEADSADRALDISIFDPTRSIQIDPNAPSPSSIFITNMISVIYRVTSPTGDRAYDIPVFCGPVDDTSRNGPILAIKCLGKESLSLDALWTARTFPARTNKVDIIRSLLSESGETKFDLPVLPWAVTNSVLALNRGEAKPFSESRTLSNSIGYHLFYDGRGVARMRPLPQTHSQTFNFRNIKVPPQYSYDLKSCSNAVEVTGATPKGSTRPISRRLVAPDSHPLAPKWIGRGGKPRYLNPIFINDTALATQAQVDARAKSALNEALLQSIETTLEVLPSPLTEPNDIVFVTWGSFGLDNRIKKMTIPLRNVGNTTVGYLRRQTPVGGPAMRVMR